MVFYNSVITVIDEIKFIKFKLLIDNVIHLYL